MTDPLLTLVARALYEDWVAEDFANEYAGWDQLADKQTWLGRAQAALSVIREQEGTLVLNMRLALDTAIKHKLETETHGGLTEFGEGGLATLRSLEREFDYLATHFRPLPAPPLEKM